MRPPLHSVFCTLEVVQHRSLDSQSRAGYSACVIVLSIWERKKKEKKSELSIGYYVLNSAPVSQ